MYRQILFNLYVVKIVYTRVLRYWKTFRRTFTKSTANNATFNSRKPLINDIPASKRLPRWIPLYEKTILSPVFNPLAGCSHAACSCSPLSGLIKTPFPLLLFAQQEQ